MMVQKAEAARPNGDSRSGRARPAVAAAIVGGAAVAGAWGAWALARRARDGAPLNAVMKTALTASEVSHPSKRR